MKKKLRRIIAAISAVTVIAFGSTSVSATTAQDVVNAARSAGILETYVVQLENFLLANEFTSNQYDMMIGGIGNIGNISLSVIQRYFPEIQSVDEFFGRGGSSSEEGDTGTTESGTTTGETIVNGELTPEEETIKDKAEQLLEGMTHEEMLQAVEEIIETGKQIGLDITAEQVGDKAFTITVKDEQGNIKLVAPIGQLVSKTGVEASAEKSYAAEVTAVCAAVLTAGAAGAYVLSRKNREIGA